MQLKGLHPRLGPGPNFIELLSTKICLAWNFCLDKNRATNQFQDKQTTVILTTKFLCICFAVSIVWISLPMSLTSNWRRNYALLSRTLKASKGSTKKSQQCQPPPFSEFPASKSEPLPSLTSDVTLWVLWIMPESGLELTSIYMYWRSRGTDVPLISHLFRSQILQTGLHIKLHYMDVHVL